MTWGSDHQTRPGRRVGAWPLAALGLVGGAGLLAGQAWTATRGTSVPRSAFGVDHTVDPDGRVRPTDEAPNGNGRGGAWGGGAARDGVGRDGAERQSAGRGGAAARLVVLGDSTVEGVGAASPMETLPVHVAGHVAARLGAPVGVTGFGVSGARTADVARHQAPRVAQRRRDGARWDAALVIVGSNDATHALPPWRMRGLTREALAATREAADAPVVLGGIPEFHTVPAVPPPLRRVLGAHADVLRHRQRRGAGDLGAPFVDIRAEASPRFLGRPETMSPDGFHPSPEGYRLWADALAATVYAIVTSSLR